MEFGKLDDITQVDFSLPRVEQVVSLGSTINQKNVYAGASIWVNKDWEGKIYPHKLKQNEYLKYYTKNFNSIELNATHYSIAPQNYIDKWCANCPDDFKFSPKIHQSISHEKQLVHANIESLEFCNMAYQFKKHLGLCFLQLPPFFDFLKLSTLETFLAQFPSELPLAVEFRHRSWFREDNFRTTAQMLHQYGVGTVITDVAGRRDVLHMQLTAPFVMIRFGSYNLHSSDYKRLVDWALQIKNWMNAGLDTVYFYLHDRHNRYSPELILYFCEQLEKLANIKIRKPQFRNIGKQGMLF